MRSVANIAELPRVQDLFESFGVRPTYVVDHPVAATESSAAILRGFLERGCCEVGRDAPLGESAAGGALIAAQQLPLQPAAGATAEDHGADRCHRGRVRPPADQLQGRQVRFQLSPHPVVGEIGLPRHDGSVLPYYDLSDEEGPDFGRFACQPFWLTVLLLSAAGDRQPLLEIPCTTGFNRRPFSSVVAVLSIPVAEPWKRLRLKGLLWHLALSRRVWLTPEHTNLADQLHLMQTLDRMPNAVFHLTFHSSSLLAGCTPFVRSRHDLDAFLARLRALLAFAVNDLNAALHDADRVCRILPRPQTGNHRRQ